MTRREEALKKIAGLIGTEYSPKSQAATKQSEYSNELFSKIAKASAMLKTAASQMRDLKRENEKLAAENQDLQSRIDDMNRHDEAEKLAEIMVQKGMLKKADVENKTAELMALDNEGFDVLRDAIENISVEKTASYNGENDLSFMYDTDNNIPVEPKTMADAASKYIPNNQNFYF